MLSEQLNPLILLRQSWAPAQTQRPEFSKNKLRIHQSSCTFGTTCEAISAHGHSPPTCEAQFSSVNYYYCSFCKFQTSTHWNYNDVKLYETTLYFSRNQIACYKWTSNTKIMGTPVRGKKLQVNIVVFSSLDWVCVATFSQILQLALLLYRWSLFFHSVSEFNLLLHFRYLFALQS